MTEEIMLDDIGEEGEKEVEEDQYLVFTIKSQEFGFQVIRVQEITSVLSTTVVPNTLPYIEGIANLRGRLASVVNFRKRFGFEPKEHDEDTRIIIVEEKGFPVGILVDSVEEVIKIPNEKVQQLPESTSTLASEESVTGVGMLGDRLIVLLNVDKVVSKTELIEVGQISQAIDNVRTRETSERPGSEKIEAAQPLNTENQTDKGEAE
jgi:purine-binding chemotaxis protein CheW